MIRRLLSSALGGLGLTWDEWHMIASGWGDGAGLSKAEHIPSVQNTPEDHQDNDFHAILAREAWYYKFGLALGRLTWALIVASLLIRFLE